MNIFYPLPLHQMNKETIEEILNKRDKIYDTRCGMARQRNFNKPETFNIIESIYNDLHLLKEEEPKKKIELLHDMMIKYWDENITHQEPNRPVIIENINRIETFINNL